MSDHWNGPPERADPSGPEWQDPEFVRRMEALVERLRISTEMMEAGVEQLKKCRGLDCTDEGFCMMIYRAMVNTKQPIKTQ